MRLPIPLNLNIPAWRSRLAAYPDMHLCNFLEFDYPDYPDQMLSTLTSPTSANSVRLVVLSRQIRSQTISRLPLFKSPTVVKTNHVS